MVIKVHTLLRSETGLSDWIDNLKQETETRTQLEQLENEHKQQAHLLILDKAPELWKAFTSLIEQEVKKLADAFPGQDAMTLDFHWDLADKIVVYHPSSRTGFTAQWNPGDMLIKLAFTEQLLGMDGVTGSHGQINFAVSPHGDVVMVYGEATGPEKIAEILFKRLLKPEDIEPQPPLSNHKETLVKDSSATEFDHRSPRSQTPIED